MKKDKSFEEFLPNKNANYFKKLNNQQQDKIITKEEVINSIKLVMDPEIPVNLYDLGLIYEIYINNNNILVNMTLTNPNCPVAGTMPENVGKSIEKIKGLSSVEVNLVWDPKWNKNMMSEDAKLALDIF